MATATETTKTSGKAEINVSFGTNGGEVKRLSVPKGSRVRDVLNAANVKYQKGTQVSRNGKPVKLGGILSGSGPEVKEGDRVTITPRVKGGL